MTNLTNLVVSTLNVAFELLVGSTAQQGETTGQRCIYMTTYANSQGIPCGYIACGPYNETNNIEGYIIIDGRLPTIQCVLSNTNNSVPYSITASYFYGAQYQA
jgi:hypothetical protein